MAMPAERRGICAVTQKALSIVGSLGHEAEASLIDLSRS